MHTFTVYTHPKVSKCLIKHQGKFYQCFSDSLTVINQTIDKILAFELKHDVRCTPKSVYISGLLSTKTIKREVK